MQLMHKSTKTSNINSRLAVCKVVHLIICLHFYMIQLNITRAMVNTLTRENHLLQNSGNVIHKMHGNVCS